MIALLSALLVDESNERLWGSEMHFCSEEIKANVQRGFNKLTRAQRDMVKLDELAMNSDWDCVLGQIFGRYSTGMEMLFPEVPFYDYDRRDQCGAEYGFFQTYGDPEAFERYAALHDEWVSLLSEERS
jgi:hypothetical protein